MLRDVLILPFHLMAMTNLITALENNAINTIYDPAHSKYWRMFNEMEAKQISANLRGTLKKSVSAILEKKSIHSSIDVRYA